MFIIVNGSGIGMKETVFKEGDVVVVNPKYGQYTNLRMNEKYRVINVRGINYIRVDYHGGWWVDDKKLMKLNGICCNCINQCSEENKEHCPFFESGEECKDV